MPLSAQNDISQQWLETMLTKKLSSEATVHSWTAKSPERREGILSEISFVTVTYSCAERSQREKAVVFKFLPEAQELAGLVKGNSLAKREVEFYKFAASEEFRTFCRKAGLNYPSPEVYWAEADDRNITIVLNNLTNDEYKLNMISAGSTLDDIKCILRSVAIIHASGVAYSDKHNLRDLGSPWDPKYFQFFVEKGLDRQIKLFKGTPVAESLIALRQVSVQMIHSRHRYYLIDTLVHGDLRTANAMFSPDNKVACIFDWQFACVGNPLADVTTLLLCSCDPSVFSNSLREVLDHYWKSFEQALKKNGFSVDLSYQDVLDNLESMWMHGYMFHTATLPYLMDTAQITEERVRAVATFLHQRGMFDNFLQSLQ